MHMPTLANLFYLGVGIVVGVLTGGYIFRNNEAKAKKFLADLEAKAKAEAADIAAKIKKS